MFNIFITFKVSGLCIVAKHWPCRFSLASSSMVPLWWRNTKINSENYFILWCALNLSFVSLVFSFLSTPTSCRLVKQPCADWTWQTLPKCASSVLFTNGQTLAFWSFSCVDSSSLALLMTAQLHHISKCKRVQPLTARDLSHIRFSDHITQTWAGGQQITHLHIYYPDIVWSFLE